MDQAKQKPRATAVVLMSCRMRKMGGIMRRKEGITEIKGFWVEREPVVDARYL